MASVNWLYGVVRCGSAQCTLGLWSRQIAIETKPAMINMHEPSNAMWNLESPPSWAHS